MKKILSVVKLLAICILSGLICAVVGTLFSKGVSFVTEIRRENLWLIFLLPIAGIVSVAVYKLLKVNNMGTNQVIESTSGKKVLSAKLAPAVFVASLLSHLCGASVGREGAALQLGGSCSVFLNKIFKLDGKYAKTLVYCSMAGVFSSVFGTPVTAAVFALEVVCVGHLCYSAAIPVFITSIVSYFTAGLLGAHAERFTVSSVPDLSFAVMWKILILSLLTVAVSYVFCLSLKYSGKLFKKLFRNDFLRIIIGGIAIVLLTLALRTYDYNGAGVDIIENIFNKNEFVPLAFAFKILFTCIATQTGFKGGEIVPTLFIGASFGAFAGSVLGLPVSFAAAVGMIGLFCGVTNCPLASIFLAAELFSGKGIGYVLVSVVICYFLSGKISLYSAQKADKYKSLFKAHKI